MTEPTKVIAFPKPDHRLSLRPSQIDAGTFPRFRKEWNRPTPVPHRIEPPTART